MKRRSLILSSATLVALPFLGRAAGAKERANPMPDALRKALERDPTAPVLGNPQGDVTLVEFFDYNCQYCHKMVGTVQQLIGSDNNLRITFREWPVFGSDSEAAARASLASLQQGKYWQMHTGLFNQRGRATEVSAMRVARQIGLDTDKLTRDMQSKQVSDHIATSFELADHMGLEGTPFFIAGDEGTFGAHSIQEMRALIRRARELDA
ncbi:MAG: Fis family transcriptional regulator [Paracoccus denitrificans]|nr:MAG: Fis family transcriptional regulator [Paracoccus denitrificans]PZO84568.1 MAG: Fis family transcriptional regulator [Paracoccus denitrificans]